ncbi:MAG: hypothetical protein ACKOAG_05205, partial [Candidatus Kapaibacterium sp.]
MGKIRDMPLSSVDGASGIFATHPGGIMLDPMFDSLLLRYTSPPPDGSPARTTGSVVFGALMRGILVIVVGFYLWNTTEAETAAFISFILLWGYVVYPAYRQYVLFHDHVEALSLDTLCGSCRHFDRSSQRCAIY